MPQQRSTAPRASPCPFEALQKPHELDLCTAPYIHKYRGIWILVTCRSEVCRYGAQLARGKKRRSCAIVDRDGCYASTLPFYWLTRNYLLRKASETFSGSKDQARPLLCRLDFCAIGNASVTQVVFPTSPLERAWSRNQRSCRLDCWSCEQKACASTLVPGDEPSTHVRSATVADRQEGVPANTASLLAPTWGTSISPIVAGPRAVRVGAMINVAEHSVSSGNNSQTTPA